MKIIKPSVEWTYGKPDGMKFLQAIELAGRTCYKSEEKINEFYTCNSCGKPFVLEEEFPRRCSYCESIDYTFPSCFKFVQNLINRGHLAMIEHAPDISMRFICDRGVSHEIVRHRLFSFAQESTRYVSYKTKEIEFIKPCFFSDAEDNGPEGTTFEDYRYYIWFEHMKQAESDYCDLIEWGANPQEARSVLPNSLKTEIVVKGNAREWMHFFELRCNPTAHPQMKEVALMALRMCHEAIPVVFDGLA